MPHDTTSRSVETVFREYRPWKETSTAVNETVEAAYEVYDAATRPGGGGAAARLFLIVGKVSVLVVRYSLKGEARIVSQNAETAQLMEEVRRQQEYDARGQALWAEVVADCGATLLGFVLGVITAPEGGLLLVVTAATFGAAKCKIDMDRYDAHRYGVPSYWDTPGGKWHEWTANLGQTITDGVVAGKGLSKAITSWNRVLPAAGSALSPAWKHVAAVEFSKVMLVHFPKLILASDDLIHKWPGLRGQSVAQFGRALSGMVMRDLTGPPPRFEYIPQSPYEWLYEALHFGPSVQPWVRP